MKKDNNSSILNEALADYNKIIEAAAVVAKKKLVDENQTKYNELLNEAINNKINNINDNEVDAELTDTTIQNETDMSKETNQAKKVSHPIGSGAPFNNKTKGVDETVTIQDTVGDTDPFTVKTKGNKIVDETVTIQNTVGDDDPFTAGAKKTKTVDETVTIQNTVGKPNPFTEKKGVNKTKQIEENYNLSEYDVTNTQEPSNEFADDEFSFDDIEAELNELESFDSEMGSGVENDEMPAEESNDEVIEQLKAMKSQLDSILAGMGVTDEVEPESNDIDDVDDLNTQSMGDNTNTGAEEVYENNEPITDDDINSFLNGENDIEEGLGVSHATNKISTARNPRPEYASSPAAAERRRPGFVQENKRISGLVEQNKNLTKRINEMKKTQESALKIAENYKSALGKYKNQLMEMAIFNTNLAHVNNLLVNESFELTHEDKVKIINEFKTVNTLAESETKYNNLLTEMKTSKQSIVENVESKITTSVHPSSKQIMNEVVEKTVYNSNSTLDKMKRTISYMENKHK